LAEVFSEKFKTVENHAPAAVIEENPPKLQPKDSRGKTAAISHFF